MRTKKKSIKEQAEKLSFRVAPAYAERVAAICEDAGLTPNQLGRIALMQLVNTNGLKIADRMARVEENLLRFRAEFNAAIYLEAGKEERC